MGLNVGEYSIALDCGEPSANVNFVSHAHSDHTTGLRKDRKVIASQITKELIQCRTGRKSIELLESHHKLKLLDAGHILGSKQLYAECDELGVSVIYSGDYQMQRSLAAEPIETRKADVLIIDSTYPEKDVTFGDREETMSSIQSYLEAKLEKGIVLFGSYSLGKPQELIKIANEVGVLPAVDGRVASINMIYKKHGMALDYAAREKDPDEFESLVRGNFMAICPAHSIKEVAYEFSSRYGKRVYTAIATGFAKTLDLGVDVQFPLSDHADFKQAVEYIEACGPDLILTRGDRECSEMFARNLRSNGYNAAAFEGSVPEVMKNRI